MKTSKILFFCILILTLNSCKNKLSNSTKNEVQTTDGMSAKEVEEIKKHIEDQKRIDSDEESFENPYKPMVRDLELASIVILQGLKNNGFKDISEEEFNQRIKYVFGIENLKSPHYKTHDESSYITLFGKQNKDYKELLKDEFENTTYTTNLYLLKKEHIITELEYLNNLIAVSKDNTYKVTIDPYIINRNKYLFNNDTASLAWLLHNDQFFASRLLTDFGFDKEPKINKMVLDSVYQEHTRKNSIRGQFIASLFFIKDSNEKLWIRDGLLKFVEDNTTSTDNRFIYALGDFLSTLYDGDEYEVFDEDPSKKFSPLEKAKIVAYVANIENPAIKKYKTANSEVWNNAGSNLYNISVSHPEIITLIEQNNYFGLPKMKGIIAALEEEAPPAPADSE